MKNTRMLFQIAKTTLLSLFFYGAVSFENAQKERLLILFAVFALYLSLGWLRGLVKKWDWLHTLSFLLDVMLVYTLEYHSRLLINYFLHLFYFVILLEAFLSLERKKALIIGSSAIIISLVKYVLLIYHKATFANMSQLIFFLLLGALILLTVNFAQYNREEREKKDLLFKELLAVHKELKRYGEEVNRLSIVEERNEIARNIHDTLGHNMTALIMQLEIVSHVLGSDRNKTEEIIENAKRTARDSLSGIRKVVETLRGKEQNPGPGQSINDMVNEFSKKTGVTIQLINQRVAGPGCRMTEIALYHIIQEALTNSLRHGRADQVMIELKENNNRIEFMIKDNGSGAIDLQEGYGLKGIRERVAALNGKVSFCSREGFVIRGYVEVEVNHD